MGAKQPSGKKRPAPQRRRAADNDTSKHQLKQQGKIHKLMKLLSLLKSTVPLDREELAAALETDARQITRYLADWSELGIRAEFNRKTRRYDLIESFFMPPLELDAEEALALVLLVEHVTKTRQIDHLGSAGSAIAKIVSVLPAAVRSEVERAKGAVHIRATVGGEEGGSDVYKTIRGAIGSLRALTCGYESASVMAGGRQGDEFIFEPYTLMFHLRGWYVVGYNRARAERRMYKVSRFTRAKPTDQPYVIPGDFSLEGYLGNAWRIMPDKNEHNIELVFEPGIANTITETRWHKTETTEVNADRSVTYFFRVSGLEEIAWWVLGYGPKVRVVRPKALAEKVAELARQTVGRYEE